MLQLCKASVIHFQDNPFMAIYDSRGIQIQPKSSATDFHSTDFETWIGWPNHKMSFLLQEGVFGIEPANPKLEELKVEFACILNFNFHFVIHPSDQSRFGTAK